MLGHQIGVRKFTEKDKVRYWLIINAKVVDVEEIGKSSRLKSIPPSRWQVGLHFIDEYYWIGFILVTIIINMAITINSFPYKENQYFVQLAVIVHMTCIAYWIDFLVAFVIRVTSLPNSDDHESRKTFYFVIDGVSLFPVSMIYLLVMTELNHQTFWYTRFITLLRFYRIMLFLSELATVERSNWKILLLTHTFYLIILIDIFANYWIMQTDKVDYAISGWNSSNLNILTTCLYFSTVTCLNIGFGDIVPVTFFQSIACCLAMIIGFIITTGVLNGVLATGFANREKKREMYRIEYETTVTALKKSKIEKRVIDKISDNLMTYWRLQKGTSRATSNYVLPVSLQKEICFDINFGFLNRSLIFSVQPRSFLRSVSLLMVNMSYFPGDTIMEPFGLNEAMICIASGVVEILSEENDETPLLSFTTGTILGEAALFMSIPVRCVIRASTIVELQVLTKGNFLRLALKYTEIYRSMRAEIFVRLGITNTETPEEMDPDIREMTRRKVIKNLLRELKKPTKENTGNNVIDTLKLKLMNLYVLSESIPKVKTLPINLIKSKPWILRPNTTLIKLWDFFVVMIVAVVCFVYPCLAGFVRTISISTHVMLFLIEGVYIIDLYIQCTTAIERNDHFTYIASIKEIVAAKLKSVQFYIDILATYDLTIYWRFIMPKDHDYAILLLSLNRILKFWRIPHYFLRLENNMNTNLLLLRTFKYLVYYSLAVVWTSVIVYLEACPGEICISDRWFAKLETKEVNESNPNPTTPWPEIVSLYWGSVIIGAVGYGDLVAKSISDCWAVLFCIALGVTVIIYCTAEASATLRNLERHRTYYQEEVFAVNRFMTDHEIPKDMQKEVRNYFRMQWNYDKAFSLRHHLTIEGMPIQQKEIILMELMKKFLTVPVFHHADTDFLRNVAKSCRIRVLPPNEIITHAGSYVRELYILENGHCEVIAEGNLRSVIGPLTPFGYIEMILGIPQYLNVRTLTHARIISLDYASYLRAVTKFPSVKSEIDTTIAQVYSGSKIKEKPLESLGLTLIRIETTSGETLTESFLSDEFINVYRYHKEISTSYWEPFHRWGKLRFFQYFLLPIVVSPHSLFLKTWQCFRIACVLLTGLVVPIHFSLSQHTEELITLIYLLQAFSWLDIYIMFHIAYYDRRGLLMFHPSKTAIWYLKNTFVLDLITTFPIYKVLQALHPKDVYPGFLYNAPGFIMTLQIYKFFQACHYLESDILGSLPNIKILKFIFLSLVATNIITGFIILLECYTFRAQLLSNITDFNLRNEYREGIRLFCSYKNETVKTSYFTELSPIRFYLSTFYWITATMTTCGFGDLSAHNTTTMVAVMLIIVLGLFLYGYMFASLTCSMISAYNSVTKYRRRIKEMAKFMKYMNANSDIQRRLLMHYEYNWRRTEGSSPQKMFLYVHAALRETIVMSMYEETIRQIPAFIDVEKSVIRVLGKYSQEVYFLGGETIVKYDDIQENIYIIYRGKVDVRTQKGKFITSMGCGGIFGNIKKKPFSLSTVAVVATRNVDVLRLNSEIFFRALQVFTNTKALIDFMHSRTTDYIQPLEEINENDSDKAAMSFRRSKSQGRFDTLPYEISLKSQRPMIQYSEMNFDERTNYLYLRESIFIPPGRKISGMVFLHDSWLTTLLTVLALIVAYVSATLSFYMFTFQDFSVTILAISYILDILYAIKIIYELNISHFDRYGNYVINKRLIRKNYVRRRKTLILEILSNAPADVLALFLPLPEKYLILSILRLNRILRLHYIHEFYEIRYRNLMINKVHLKLSWIFINSLLLIHFFSCIWYFITCPLGYEVEHTWVTAMKLDHASNFQLYVYSVYYIITLTTTTGYGDIILQSTLEIIVSTIIMIATRFGVAVLAGSMAAVIGVHSLNLYLYQELISNLRETFSRQNLSAYQLDKLWNYVTSLWLKKSLKKIPKFIETAPHVMKCEIMNSIYGHHLSQCYLFMNTDEAFLRHLAIYLKRFIYFPGNYIVQQGDIDSTMYFIHKGQVSVLTIHHNMTETIHFKMQDNDYFGMEQGLTMGMAHHFSYRAETEAEILSLTLSHWQRLLKYFPNSSHVIYGKLQSLPGQIEVANNH